MKTIAILGLLALMMTGCANHPPGYTDNGPWQPIIDEGQQESLPAPGDSNREDTDWLDGAPQPDVTPKPGRQSERIDGILIERPCADETCDMPVEPDTRIDGILMETKE